MTQPGGIIELSRIPGIAGSFHTGVEKQQVSDARNIVFTRLIPLLRSGTAALLRFMPMVIGFESVSINLGIMTLNL